MSPAEIHELIDAEEAAAYLQVVAIVERDVHEPKAVDDDTRYSITTLGLLAL